jgi:DNA polymerase-3 subunit epsilon
MTAQFDMFATSDDASPSPGRSTEAHRTAKIPLGEEEMVERLVSTGRYRILKKLEPRPVAKAAGSSHPLRALILDTETTGLDHRKHDVIEIGLVSFTFNDQGDIGDVVGVYGGLQQPGMPIPAEITRLTGITDQMVAGQVIDMDAVRALLDGADLVIAHNAGFDRPFCEAFSTGFAGKAWACSVAEVNWRERGFEGTKLAYLIGQAGYFHDGHRAVDDCFALLEVLALPAADGSNALSELYRSSQQSRVRVYAENSPFEMKDHLKARGYRWSDGSDGRPKSWWLEVDEDALEDERHYLRSEIYRYPDADPPIKRLTAFERYRR